MGAKTRSGGHISCPFFFFFEMMFELSDVGASFCFPTWLSEVVHSFTQSYPQVHKTAEYAGNAFFTEIYMIIQNEKNLVFSMVAKDLKHLFFFRKWLALSTA